MVKFLLSTCVSLVLLFNAAGCGFHLQGSYNIPPALKTLSLESSDEYSELTRLVKDQLRLSGIKLTPPGKQFPMLRLVRDSLDRTTLSLYPTGQVAEYELIYQVNFSVQFPDQEAQSFDVQIRRDYLDDPRVALAKSRELEMLLREMRQQAADNIIQTLAAIEKP